MEMTRDSAIRFVEVCCLTNKEAERCGNVRGSAIIDGKRCASCVGKALEGKALLRRQAADTASRRNNEQL